MPKIVDRDAYRRELLDKSFDSFADRGYSVLTMRELAQRIGVSTGRLYHYFPSKDDVFDALVAHIMEEEIEFAVAALPSRQEPGEGLLALFRYVDQSSRRLVKSQLIAIDYSRHRPRAAKAAFRRSAERFNRTITKLTGIADPLTIQLVSAVVQGLLVAKELDGESVDFEAHARLLAPLASRRGTMIRNRTSVM